MAGVARIGESGKAFHKKVHIVPVDRGAERIERGGKQGERFRFFPFFLVFLYGVDRFAYLTQFETGKVPVTVLSGKPELGVVNLYAGHEFAESRFVAVCRLHLKVIDLFLKLMDFRRVAAGSKQQGENQENFLHGNAPFVVLNQYTAGRTVVQRGWACDLAKGYAVFHIAGGVYLTTSKRIPFMPTGFANRFCQWNSVDKVVTL